MRENNNLSSEARFKAFMSGFEAGVAYERSLNLDEPIAEPKTTRKRRTKKYKWSYHQRKKLSAKLKQAHDKKKALGLAWKGNHINEQTK